MLQNPRIPVAVLALRIRDGAVAIASIHGLEALHVDAMLEQDLARQARLDESPRVTPRAPAPH